MNLIECFGSSFFTRAHKEALLFETQRFTFGQINEESDRIANALQARYAIKKGDRVSMYIENCPEMILFYLA